MTNALPCASLVPLATEEKQGYSDALAPDLIVVTNREGIVQYVNEPGADLLLCRPQDLIGKRPEDLYSPEVARSYLDHIGRVIKTGEPMTTEWRICLNNQERWLGVRFNPLRDHAGQVTKVLTMARDITQLVRDLTERHNAEEALRDSETRYRQLVEMSPDAVFIQCEGRFVYINPAGLRLFGASLPNQMLGQMVLDRVTPECREAVAERMRTLREEGQAVPLNEYQWLRLDGSSVHVEVVAAPFTFQGKLAAQVVARDISQRKQAEAAQAKLEAQLREAQKMEAIGTLAGGIAHDFNNILGIIFGFTELAKADASRNRAAQENLDQVLKAAHRAKDLVQQILAFSRRQEHERKPVQLQLIIKEALKLLRATLPSTIEIRRNLQAPDFVVLADPSQLHQIMMNLCANAAYAMRSRGGILEVSLTPFYVGSELPVVHPGLRPGKYLRLSVADTGCGMDAATRARIFEPFFTTKPVGEGTGLGLAVVDGIIRSHEGAIQVYSEPGKGTTFHIYLPANETAALPTTTPETKVHCGHGQRILLVDDEPQIAFLGTKMLEHLGYQATAYTAVETVLADFLAHSNEYDLVITDLTMPGLTGTELAAQLGQIQPGLPIILATGFSAGLDETMTKAHGIREVVLKPFSIQALGEAIQRALAGSYKHRDKQMGLDYAVTEALSVTLAQ